MSSDKYATFLNISTPLKNIVKNHLNGWMETK